MLSLVEWCHLGKGGKGWKFAQASAGKELPLLWKKVGDSVLYARGKAIYCPWGLGADYCCATGSGACERLGKETRTAQQVLAEWTMRMHRVWCWTFRVSLAGLDHWHLLRDQSALRIQRASWHPPLKHFILAILCHLSLANIFFPSPISLVLFCLNTSMWHTVLILLTAGDILFGHASWTGCTAAGDRQVFTGCMSVNFDNSIELWMLVLQNSCLMCSDKVREHLMIFKKKREMWQCFE